MYFGANPEKYKAPKSPPRWDRSVVQDHLAVPHVQHHCKVKFGLNSKYACVWNCSVRLNAANAPYV